MSYLSEQHPLLSSRGQGSQRPGFSPIIHALSEHGTNGTFYGYPSVHLYLWRSVQLINKRAQREDIGRRLVRDVRMATIDVVRYNGQVVFYAAERQRLENARKWGAGMMKTPVDTLEEAIEIHHQLLRQWPSASYHILKESNDALAPFRPKEHPRTVSAGAIREVLTTRPGDMGMDFPWLD